METPRSNIVPPRAGVDYAPPIYRTPSATPRSRSQTTSSSNGLVARKVGQDVAAIPETRTSEMTRPAMLRRSILESVSAGDFENPSTSDKQASGGQRRVPPSATPIPPNTATFSNSPMNNTQPTLLMPSSRQVPTTATVSSFFPSTATLRPPPTTTNHNLGSYNVATSPLYDGKEPPSETVSSYQQRSRESSSRNSSSRKSRSISQSHSACLHCGCQGERHNERRRRPRTECRKNRHKRSLSNESVEEPKKAPHRKNDTVQHRSRSGTSKPAKKTARTRRRSATPQRSLSRSLSESRSVSRTQTTSTSEGCDVVGCGMKKKNRSAGKKPAEKTKIVTQRGRHTVSRRNRDSDSTRSSSASSTSSLSSVELPNRERPKRRGFSFSSTASIEDHSTNGSSTAWDVDSKFMMAIRAGPTDCPDYVLANHPHFGEEGPEGEGPSPFQMYYFDETAPNEILLANDVKGEHPMTVAKKNFKAFLNCQGGKEETYVVDGDDYVPEGVQLPESDSLSRRDRGLDEDEESEFYVQSYYTESAFTSVSAGAINRGQLREKEKQLEKQLQKQKTTAEKKSAPCCGRGRKMSAPSTVEELSQLQSHRDSSASTPREIRGMSGVHQSRGIPQAAQMPVASRNFLMPPPAVPNAPYYSLRATSIPMNYPHATQPMQFMSKQAKPLRSISGSESARGCYQKFSKVRQTNYVAYTPPATIAHRYGHPAYQAALAAETVRQQHNEGLPSVWPQTGSAPIRVGPYDHSATSSTLESVHVSSSQQPVIKPRGRSNRPQSRNHRSERRPHSGTQSQGRHGRHRSHRKSSVEMRTRSVSYEDEPRHKVKDRRAAKRRGSATFGTSAPTRSSVADSRYETITRSLPYTESGHISRRSDKEARRPRNSRVCPHCRGAGHVKGKDGRASLCNDCCLAKNNGKSGLCCGGKDDTISLPPSDSQSFSFRARGDLDTESYSEDEDDTYHMSKGVDPTDVVNFGPADVAALGYLSDDGSVHKYRSSDKKEKDRDLGYHVRKNFFDATKMKVSEKGSDCKMLPQYSVSYRNYPTICYDVVVPTSNKDFYRVRKAPGFATA